jgi:hypothetical protein
MKRNFKVLVTKISEYCPRIINVSMNTKYPYVCEKAEFIQEFIHEEKKS